MRRMFSKKQLISLIDQEVLAKAVESLVGKSVSVGSLTTTSSLEVGGDTIFNGEANRFLGNISISMIVGTGSEDENNLTILGNLDVSEIPESEDGGNLTAKTITQTEANYIVSEENFTCFAETGLVITKGYCRFEVINNIAYCVANISISNPTENNITLGNTGYIRIQNIPQAVSSKIYTFDGDTIDEEFSAAKEIMGCDYASDKGLPNIGFYDGGVASVSSLPAVANALRINLRNAGVVNANTTHNISLRFFLTLI